MTDTDLDFKVLICDDNNFNLFTLRSMLEDIGVHNIDEGINGLEAVKLCER